MKKIIIIKNILLEEKRVDITIANGKFEKIEPTQEKEEWCEKENLTVINGQNMAIMRPFYNTHTHAAMTLLRGYADDMPLFPWLNDYIWPFEAVLTPNDIYHGTRLAILEMIKSGTIFFNDMYWDIEATIRACEEMEIKAAIGVSFIEARKEEKKSFDTLDALTAPGALPPMTQITLAPHAIYTVGEKLFKKIVNYSEQKNIIIHTHISETKKEVEDCLQLHGVRPIEWLHKLGALSERCVAAHCVHLTPEEIELLAKKKVTIAHNPISNMKLASGTCKTTDILDAGCRLTIGTDGCSSNNNLDMREEMKFASMLAKSYYQRPELLPARRLFKHSAISASKAFNLNSGEIKVGKAADAILINLRNERMTPNYNTLSNFLYSADSHVINTVICNGNLLMHNRKVKNEMAIIDKANECSERLLQKIKKKQ